MWGLRAALYWFSWCPPTTKVIRPYKFYCKPIMAQGFNPAKWPQKTQAMHLFLPVLAVLRLYKCPAELQANRNEEVVTVALVKPAPIYSPISLYTYRFTGGSSMYCPSERCCCIPGEKNTYANWNTNYKGHQVYSTFLFQRLQMSLLLQKVHVKIFDFVLIYRVFFISVINSDFCTVRFCAI